MIGFEYVMVVVMGTSAVTLPGTYPSLESCAEATDYIVRVHRGDKEVTYNLGMDVRFYCAPVPGEDYAPSSS